MIERAKGAVLLFADLPEDQRVPDEDRWLRERFRLAGIRPPAHPERCLAASQGDTAHFRELVKCGQFFRCVGRRRGGDYCVRHRAIARAGAAAVR